MPMAAREISSRAYARVGLVGNPSDGFGGKTIAVSIENYSATVTIRESADICFEPNPYCDSLSGFASLASLHGKLARDGYRGGIILLQATCKRFHEYCTENGITLPRRNFTLTYDTDIPRQVRAGSGSAATRRGHGGAGVNWRAEGAPHAFARLKGSSAAHPFQQSFFLLSGFLLTEAPAVSHHPVQVGLAGSSAIITATLRCLLRFFDIADAMPMPMRPTFALSVEVGELGITAGLQVREKETRVGCRCAKRKPEQKPTTGEGELQSRGKKQNNNVR